MEVRHSDTTGAAGSKNARCERRNRYQAFGQRCDNFGTAIALITTRKQGRTSGAFPEDIPLIRKVGAKMLSWALTFLVIALIAALLGFGGIAGTASWIAQILFVVFLILFVISLVAPRLRPPVS